MEEINTDKLFGHKLLF